VIIFRGKHSTFDIQPRTSNQIAMLNHFEVGR